MARSKATLTYDGSEAEVPRRQQLLSIASELFAQRGFAGTGVDDIGEAAGLSGPAIYRHFANKQAILDALVVEAMQRLVRSAEAVAQPDGDPDSWLDALIRVRLEFAFGPDRFSFVVIRSERDNISRTALRKIASMEERYLADWVRVLTALRPKARTTIIRQAIHAAHVFMGYLALEDSVEDDKDNRDHIAAMARAALFA
jgi:AcrR family transcriptional regulator